MNFAIEIHDSRLKSIKKRGELLEVQFEAYIHSSEGVPGVDAGTGCMQDVVLLFTQGDIQGAPTQTPVDLLDGEFEVDGELKDNCIPIPLEGRGAARLTLITSAGPERPILVRGTEVRLELQGIPQYIDDFPGV